MDCTFLSLEICFHLLSFSITRLFNFSLHYNQRWSASSFTLHFFHSWKLSNIIVDFFMVYLLISYLYKCKNLMENNEWFPRGSMDSLRVWVINMSIISQIKITIGDTIISKFLKAKWVIQFMFMFLLFQKRPNNLHVLFQLIKKLKLMRMIYSPPNLIIEPDRTSPMKLETWLHSSSNHLKFITNSK